LQTRIKTLRRSRAPDQDHSLVFRRLIALIGLLIAPFVSGAQDSQTPQNGSGSEYTLRVDANMVILSATVLDRHNTPVSGLDKGDFQVYEDRKLQKIMQFSHDDIPVTAGILVDNSGSMGPKRDDVIAAAMAFARSSNPQDQMFVVNFNDRVSYGLPPGIPFTDRQEELQLALSTIRTIGQTSLYDGIVTALDHLKQGTRDKKVLILISDGGDNVSKHSLAQVLGMAKQTSAIIYAIGIFDEQDGDQNPGVLRRLARETGGEAFSPESSKEVPSICEEIARDIRSQYTLAYVPTIGAEDGSYRTVEVRASLHSRGHLSVRTRSGYSVPLTMPAATTKAIPHDSRN
jgi:Ca-activated chloride channel family protein